MATKKSPKFHLSVCFLAQVALCIKGHDWVRKIKNNHFEKGSFTIYVCNFSQIIDHLPTYVYNFYIIDFYKLRFSTTYLYLPT